MNNSAADCLISLKFYTGFGHTTPEVPQKSKVKESKVKVTARRNESYKLLKMDHIFAPPCTMHVIDVVDHSTRLCVTFIGNIEYYLLIIEYDL